jgi:hypothetical protein
VLTYREKADVESGLLDLDARPNLYLSIRNLLLEEVTSQVEGDMPAVKELAKEIREEIAIHSATKRDPFNEVAGVDAGSHMLPLASRRFAVISALAYSFPSGRRFFLEPESFCFPYRIEGGRLGGIINSRREAKLFETATQYVESDPEARLLLVDGPLVFSNWWGRAGGEADRQRLITAVRGFLDVCREKGVSVAGVVKRPSARYLVYNLGLQRATELPDSFLLLHALRPGERTDIFSPRSAIQKAVQATPFHRPGRRGGEGLEEVHRGGLQGHRGQGGEDHRRIEPLGSVLGESSLRGTSSTSSTPRTAPQWSTR